MRPFPDLFPHVPKTYRIIICTFHIKHDSYVGCINVTFCASYDITNEMFSRFKRAKPSTDVEPYYEGGKTIPLSRFQSHDGMCYREWQSVI